MAVADGFEEFRLREVGAAFELGIHVFAKQGSPLYSGLCVHARNDADLLALAAHAAPGQPPAFHLLSAVHFLLLSGIDHPLARHFANLTPAPEAAEKAYGPFRSFCFDYADEIREILASRTVQSTSVERAVFALMALDHLYRQVNAPLHLIEIGCSAGLLMLFDKYHYDFGKFGTVNTPEAAVRVDARLHGPFARAASGIPPVASRVGVDLQPVDAAAEVERRWLLALIFPEWLNRQRNLDVALDLAARSKLRILQGDANELLPGLLAQTPDPVCVFHSMCLYYFGSQAQERFDHQLRQSSRGRTIHRIGVEMPESYALETRKAAATGSAVPTDEVPAHVVHTAYRDGESHAVTLAHTGRYGQWFEWLVPERSTQRVATRPST